MKMNAVVLFLRDQLKDAHTFLEMTMSGILPEHALWLPPGRTAPIAALYAHVAIFEDTALSGVFKAGAPLAFSTWAGKTGVSVLPPLPTAENKGLPTWDQWARSVQVDLEALRSYAQAVYAASDAFLAAIQDDALGRLLDLSSFGFGQQSMGWFLNNMILGHVSNHCGEIACLKGLQGLHGYPV